MKFDRAEIWAAGALIVAVLVLIYGDNWSGWHPSSPLPTPAATPFNNGDPSPRIELEPSPKKPKIKRSQLATPPQPQSETAPGETAPVTDNLDEQRPLAHCGGEKGDFVLDGPIEVAFAQCAVIAYSTNLGRWGIRLAGWVHNRSDATRYSTVSELRDGQLGYAGYVGGWHGSVSDGGACEIRDLGNAALPVSGLFEGLRPENAARALDGQRAQSEALAAGGTKGFQVFLFCPDGTDARLQVSGNARLYVFEGGYWVPHDFSFDAVPISGRVLPK